MATSPKTIYLTKADHAKLLALVQAERPPSAAQGRAPRANAR